MTFPDPAKPGLTPLRELVGARVDVASVEHVDGIPVVETADGRRLLCSSPWSSAGATYLEGELATNGGPIPVRVVDEAGQPGFRPVESPPAE